MQDHFAVLDKFGRNGFPIPFANRAGTGSSDGSSLWIEAKQDQRVGMSTFDKATPLLPFGSLLVHKHFLSNVHFICLDISPRLTSTELDLFLLLAHMLRAGCFQVLVTASGFVQVCALTTRDDQEEVESSLT